MTAPSTAPTVASDGVDAQDAYDEACRQWGMALGQIVQLRMLVDKRGARIAELERAIRAAQAPAGDDS